VRFENLLLTSVGGEKRNNVMLVELDKEDIEAAEQWCEQIVDESLRKEYIKIDAANRALVRTIAAKDAQIAKLEKDREIPWTDK
jgi:hypothetical protein